MSAQTTSHPLELAFQTERAEHARLQADIDQLREHIASLDLTIEQERAALSAFEQRYCAALEQEHALLARIDSFLRHLASLGRLVSDQAIRPKERQQHLRMLHRLRASELSAWHARRLAAKQARARQEPTQTAHNSELATQALTHAARMTERQERIRTVYRQLARRFHPDLARDDAAREAHSRLMAHVNSLYAQDDLERLLALGERTDDDAQACLDAQSGAVQWQEALERLREQHVWTTAIRDSLQDEARDLDQCAVAELRRAVHRPQRRRTRDPFESLRADAKGRAHEQIKQLPAAIFSLEQRVKRARSQARTATTTSALAQASSAVAAFDPHVGHVLCKLSLAAMDKQKLTPRMQRMANMFVDLGHQDPALLRLVLFAYVAELTPQPLDALATYEAIAIRFDALARDDNKRSTLSETLVQGDGLVQYRVDKAHTNTPRLTLGLRDKTLTQAIAGALDAPEVRDQFANVLLHLGEAVHCSDCRRDSFEVPLFFLRGLDDLRATVCAHCGHAIRRYVLARGEDVQTVLNQAYVDMGLLYECSIGIGRRQVALQYLARQTPFIAARDVIGRVCRDLFARNQLSIRQSDVTLYNHDKPVSPSAPLASLFEPSLRLVGRGHHVGRERQWCEELSYRVRTRYVPRSAFRP